MEESLLLLLDSSGGHPRALSPQHPLPARASQEQPVLSLRLQADPFPPPLTQYLQATGGARSLPMAPSPPPPEAWLPSFHPPSLVSLKS